MCLFLQDPATLHKKFIEECFTRLESLVDEQKEDIDQLVSNKQLENNDTSTVHVQCIIGKECTCIQCTNMYSYMYSVHCVK